MTDQIAEVAGDTTVATVRDLTAAGGDQPRLDSHQVAGGDRVRLDLLRSDLEELVDPASWEWN